MASKYYLVCLSPNIAGISKNVSWLAVDQWYEFPRCLNLIWTNTYFWPNNETTKKTFSSFQYIVSVFYDMVTKFEGWKSYSYDK